MGLWWALRWHYSWQCFILPDENLNFAEKSSISNILTHMYIKLFVCDLNFLSRTSRAWHWICEFIRDASLGYEIFIRTLWNEKKNVKIFHSRLSFFPTTQKLAWKIECDVSTLDGIIKEKVEIVRCILEGWCKTYNEWDHFHIIGRVQWMKTLGDFDQSTKEVNLLSLSVILVMNTRKPRAFSAG